MEKHYASSLMRWGTLLLLPFCIIGTTVAQTEVAKLISSDAELNDRFGYSVSISGDRAVVGSLWAQSAYVFGLKNGIWEEVALLKASDLHPYFGRSVSMDGDKLVVGAPHGSAGAAYVFQCLNGIWVEIAKLSPSIMPSPSYFGNSVSINGNRVLVGDHQAGPVENYGAAYVFDFIGGIWTETAKLQASDKQKGDRFGTSVSLCGNRAVIGSPWEDAEGIDAGAAYIFDLVGGIWAETTKLLSSDLDAMALFGRSVSVSNDRVIVGAICKNEYVSQAGAAYIFDLVNGEWLESTKLQPTNLNSGAEFGGSVAIQDNLALVGAHWESIGVSQAGAAHLYEFVNGTWIEKAILKASDRGVAHHFGESVSLNGNRAIIGTMFESPDGNRAGAAYIYEWEPSNPPPIAICRNITLPLNEIGQATLDPHAIDNGSSGNNIILSVSPKSFNCSNIGENLVTLTVTDEIGRTITCASTITIIDNTPPLAACQDVTLLLDIEGNGNLTAEAINNGSYDACGIKSIALDKTLFTCSNVGINPVILTVTDNNGNISNCNATVTVIDNVPPVVVCRDALVHLDASGNGSINVESINNGSNDGCGIKSAVLNKTSFNCSNLGENPVILTVTDNNDNVSTCTAIVNVVDNILPLALCQDVIVYLDSDGNADVSADAINNGSQDVCGIKSISLDKSNFTCSQIGVNRVTLTVTDNNENTSTCQANVTVINTPPEFISIIGPENPVPLGSSVILNISFYDTNATSLYINWGDNQDNTYTNLSGAVIAEHQYSTPGVYSVNVTLSDICEKSISFEYKYVVVYDPNGGFVTGGGWIISPAGAYKLDPALSGKANFGFIAKYKKGSTIPDGNTEFQFKAGNLNFKSSSYEDMRLVISGARANFKGKGTINGTGNYGFMVSAIDGQIDGGGGIDKFRIKIWDLYYDNAIVYDNNLIDTDENSEPLTAIDGGSIVIHSEQSKSGESELASLPEKNPIVKLYPNPFSESLQFEFASPSKGNARIEIYDVSGRLVKVIFNNRVEEGILYKAEFRPYNNMEGIYFYRIKYGQKEYFGRAIYQK